MQRPPPHTHGERPPKTRMVPAAAESDLSPPEHVVVIGGGIVGACVGLALVEAGRQVTIVEPEQPGGEQAASYGNGAWISPASVVPMSMPGLWKKVPGFLLDPLGPLTIRWTSLPSLAPWLRRFLAAGASVERVERTASALSRLLTDAPAGHRAIAASVGRPDLIRSEGLLYVYPDRTAFEAEALAWRLRRDNGVAWVEWDEKGLREKEPDLSTRYKFAAYVPAGAQCFDPGAYVAAIVQHACGIGARLLKAKALSFEFRGSSLRAVLTSAGRISCEKAVVAAGVWSGGLARDAGSKVPLASERGYHVSVDHTGVGPRHPTMPADGKMGIAITGGGLRASGQVELAAMSAEPDWRRAEILLRHLQASYPDLKASGVKRWMGHRPSTPDGLPVIGRSRSSPDVFFAFGHGHIGLAAAPATAKLVSELITGAPASIQAAAFSPDRFRG
jgi:D-amino-acid dehydrogenase